MAEQVTQFDAVKGGDVTRVTAMLERFGGNANEVRGTTDRDADAMFQWLAAAKARLPVAAVHRHVCHHDEGQGACTVDQEA